MTEVERLTDQMQRAVEGDAWHGPSLMQVLDGVDDKLAVVAPLAHAHSIWEIVLHLIGTQRLLLRRLRGDHTALELPPEEDWPRAPRETADDWSDILKVLQDSELYHAGQINLLKQSVLRSQGAAG